MKHIETNSINLILINNKDKNNVNKELYRVLKPGGYLFGVDKPHKSHNSVCDIEDIGFIVKDSISYFFAKNNKVELDTICLVMKPLSEKNFAENVMKWGTGGLNIDGARIGSETININGGGKKWRNNGEKIEYVKAINETREGRYPSNFIIDKNIAHILDGQSDGVSRYFYNTTSYKDLLRYITVLGLPPIQSTVLFVGFNDANTIIEEINKNSNVKYEAIIMEEVK